MELDEFLAKLAESPRGWQLWSSKKMIRRNSMCPISVLRGFFACSYQSAATALGIDSRLAEKIATAADAEQDPTSELGKIRAKLLRACGLEAGANPGS